MPTELSGYEQTTHRSGLAAWMARMIGEIVGGVRRVSLVVDDLEAVLLGVGAGALGGIARELGVLGGDCEGLRLWILRRRDLEESFGDGRLRIRAAGRDAGEVSRVFELGVGIERKQADEHLVLLHDDRNGGRHHVGRIAADHEVGFVDVEELGVDAGHIRRVGLVVIMDQLNLTAEQSALGVDFLRPDLRAEQCLLAVHRQRAGQRHAEADLDRLAALGKSANSGQRGRNQCGANSGIDAAPRDMFAQDTFAHGFLQKVVVLQPHNALICRR